MKTFGEWLHERRKQLEMTLDQMAATTDVDKSTLSRLENERTKPTLETVIKICHGLDIAMTDLLTSLLGTDVVTTIQSPSSRGTLHMVSLTQDDINGFAALARQDIQQAMAILGDGLDQARAHISPSRSLPFPSNEGLLLALVLQDPLVYHVELAYPDDFDGSWAYLTYHSGGAVTYTDVGIYMRDLRQVQQLTQVDLEHHVMYSRGIVSRLESGVTSKIKLDRILDIQDSLSDHDMTLIGMFWQATQFHGLDDHVLRIGDWGVSTSKLAATLMVISRWLQVQNQFDTQWLTDFRQRIRS